MASVGEAAQLSLAIVLVRDSGLRSQSQIRVSSVLTRLVMSRQSSHFNNNLEKGRALCALHLLTLVSSTLVPLLLSSRQRLASSLDARRGLQGFSFSAYAIAIAVARAPVP